MPRPSHFTVIATKSSSAPCHPITLCWSFFYWLLLPCIFGTSLRIPLVCSGLFWSDVSRNFHGYWIQ
jgi:hypothetical protein